MTDDPTGRTDIIPALRVHDTPPLGSPLPAEPGRHRRRRGPHPVVLTALIGTPTAAAMCVTGLWLGGSLKDKPPALQVSPSPARTAGPTLAEPAPTRTGRTGADRTRPRRPVLVVPGPRKTRTRTPSPPPSPEPSLSEPSPTPRKPSASPSPTPTTSPTPTGSASPTATATATEGGLRVP